MRRSKAVGNLVQQSIFIGPALLFFVLTVMVPFGMGLMYSFTNWNGVNDHASFIGLRNYISLFSDTNFIKSFWFTAKFTVVVVGLANLCAFTLALLLTSSIKFKNIYRAIFFLPNVISGFILGFIWQFIFVRVFMAIGEFTGIGIFQLPWLGTPATGLWGTVIVQVWQMAGYLMVIYIAGLMSVPRDLIESAQIDGAAPWQRLRHITIPMIMPSVTVCLFLSTSTAFKLFDLNFSLTKGTFDTRSIALDIYSEAFTSNNYGLGTAKAIVFFLIVALVTIIQTSITKKKEIDA